MTDPFFLLEIAMQDASGRETTGEREAKPGPGSIACARVRHRSEWLRTHGYVEHVGDGTWTHGTGDVVTKERVATISEREWPSLRDWIARQAREIAAAEADIAGTVE